MRTRGVAWVSASRHGVAAAALALLVLASPFALAQEAATLEIRLSPATLTAHVAQNVSSIITVENRGLSVMVVALSVTNVTGGLKVGLTDSLVEVLPGRTATAQAVVKGDRIGDWRATIVAQEEDALGANRTNRATAILRVLVSNAPANGTGNSTNSTNSTNTTPGDPNASAPPPSPGERSTGESPGNATREGASDGTSDGTTEGAAPAGEASAENGTSPTDDEVIIQPVPDADPPGSAPGPRPEPVRANITEMTLAASPGQRAVFTVGIENPGPVAQRVDAVLRLPLGWGGALDVSSFELNANAGAVLRGSVTPNAQATDAEGMLELTGPGGIATLRLSLVLLDTLPSAPPRMASSSSEDPDGTTIADENVAAASAAEGAPDRDRITLRVEPARVTAAPGTSIVFTLHVENRDAQPLEGEAAFEIADADLPIDVASPFFATDARSTATLTFIVHVPEDAPLGTSYEGLARALGREAPFTIVTDAVALGSVLLVMPDDRGPVWLALGVGGVAAGAISLAPLQRRWPLLGFAALYARLAPRRALEHPRRQQMVDLLRAEPGMTLADAQRRLGLSNGVARHHVQLLAAAGIVRVVHDGALRRLYPTDAPRVEATPALRERALTAIRARGEVRASELAQQLGVSRQALHYHLKKLECDGAIVAAREGTEVVLAAAT